MTHTNKQHATDRPTSRDASHLKNNKYETILVLETKFEI